tara:strand:+ start:24162 stop:24551 length:390 start_codon:yes stop_codon:yes gene_type:complete
MPVFDSKKPAVLRVTEYILNKNKMGESFSVQSAASSEELNGIDRYQIARIIRDICLDPEDEKSRIRFTTVDNSNIDNTFCRWQLSANAYFSYLSYQSIRQSEKANEIAKQALFIAVFSVTITFFTTIFF